MNPSSTRSSTQRALAAIVLTDAVSFSARMSVDEEGTLALIQRDLDLIARFCDRHEGQVLKSTGDGLLMSFSSAVQAVSCSQAIQKELAQLSEGLESEDYLLHRIGIHLGDVLFSHGDVLGNGVNIAARLQTQAAPGAICISQTVHDVVKARLQLEANFLGPLKLKNIREPVPAFQIPPVGQTSTMVMKPSPAQSDPQSLVSIVKTLQEHPQARRIKKLLYGTHQGAWQNDPTVLAQFELLSLVEALCHRYPTLLLLQDALQDIASLLNRKAEYLEIADIILTALQPAYVKEPGGNCNEEETSLGSREHPYAAVAAALESQSEQLRIKKLLYAVIHKAWENDSAVLAQHSMSALVSDVHQIATTEDDLSQHLEGIIRRLNHQTRYTQLALLISEAFHPLYGDSSVATVGQPEETILDAESIEQTAVMERQKPAEGARAMSHTRLAQATQIMGKGTGTAEEAASIAATSTTATPTRPRSRANLFGLRLEIMRYTSPLRAKILLLSTVRSPFNFSQQDWIILKSKTLDDLIQETFHYCKTYADLESKLTIICHCVDSFTENQQVVGTILKAMKPFYS
ncbi:MAG: adenylate/guanylate cyclase domain-containing protein [Cyanobacteria bacterium P01_H01_bin.58]